MVKKWILKTRGARLTYVCVCHIYQVKGGDNLRHMLIHSDKFLWYVENFKEFAWNQKY